MLAEANRILTDWISDLFITEASARDNPERPVTVSQGTNAGTLRDYPRSF